MKTFSIEKKLFIDVPSSVLFEVLTNPEKIIQYYPVKEVISNRQVGGEIIIKGNHEGNDFTDYGVIDELIPNQKFQYTYWSDNHGTERKSENYLTICYTLNEVENGTHLNVEHRNLKSEEMYSTMSQVWDVLLSNLTNFVKTQ